jgi:hypothetical protein
MLDRGAMTLWLAMVFLIEMTVFHEFLTQLLDQGKVVFRSTRAPHDRPSARGIAILAEAFETTCLSVAGPRVAFDPAVACAAAELVRQASWALVCHDERIGDLEKRLKMPVVPATASHHLSADLMLRYVPQILRRARGLDPSDPLVELLAKILRRWPLSGVLSDVDEGPLVPLDFGGHSGLLLLYAERLIANERPSWRPEQPGKTWDYYELVLEEHGRAASAVETARASDPMRWERVHGG